MREKTLSEGNLFISFSPRILSPSNSAPLYSSVSPLFFDFLTKRRYSFHTQFYYYRYIPPILWIFPWISLEKRSFFRKFTVSYGIHTCEHSDYFLFKILSRKYRSYITSAFIARNDLMSLSPFIQRKRNTPLYRTFSHLLVRGYFRGIHGYFPDDEHYPTPCHTPSPLLSHL